MTVSPWTPALDDRLRVFARRAGISRVFAEETGLSQGAVLRRAKTLGLTWLMARNKGSTTVPDDDDSPLSGSSVRIPARDPLLARLRTFHSDDPRRLHDTARKPPIPWKPPL